MKPNESQTDILAPFGPHISNDEGQGVLEYILTLFAVVTFFLIIVAGLARLNVTKKVVSPLKQGFAAAYQYGDARAIKDSGSNLPAQGHIRFQNHLFFDPIIE